MRHIPNILSAVRIILVGVFVRLFLAGSYLPAISVYVLAFLTDILDGQLARRFCWTSELGKLLDPLADKLMTVAALVCIYVEHRRTAYLVLLLLVAFKELLMLAGSIFMAKRSVVAFAAWPGKLATGLFTAGVVLSLLSFLRPSIEPANLYILFTAAGLSYFALIYYATNQLPRAFLKNGAVKKGKQPPMAGDAAVDERCARPGGAGSNLPNRAGSNRPNRAGPNRPNRAGPVRK